MTPPPPLSSWEQAWRLMLVAVLSLATWVITLNDVISQEEATGRTTPEPVVAWVLGADPLLGLVALLLVLQRRRWPLAVAVLTIALSTVSGLAAGPALLALASLATRRRPREIAIAGVLAVTAAVVFERVYPYAEPAPLWFGVVGVSVLVAGFIAIFYAVGADRERRQSARDRAETWEREQHARVAAARAEERTRIAREMHDVLAHRISLVSMHAGALTYRDDLPRDQQVAVARTIEDNAQLAMNELRDVLGVLRSPDGGDGIPQPPQPGLEDLPGLVVEARAAGARIELDNQLAASVPTTTGRTVYRIVQESLTNARKHAPACSVTVTIEGGPGEGVEVVVSNPLPMGAAATAAGAGMGLLGLRERVDLLGGTLGHGAAGGRFVVRASLPWSA